MSATFSLRVKNRNIYTVEKNSRLVGVQSALAFGIATFDNVSTGTGTTTVMIIPIMHVHIPKRRVRVKQVSTRSASSIRRTVIAPY